MRSGSGSPCSRWVPRSRVSTPGRRGRRRREQDLAAVARGGDPRGADHVEPGVPLLAEVGHARVEAHPHLDDETVGPGRGRGSAPGPPSAACSAGCTSPKTAESSSPVASTSVPPVGGDLRAEEPADVARSAAGTRRRRSGRAGSSLDVGEQERDGAGRQLHAASLRRLEPSHRATGRARGRSRPASASPGRAPGVSQSPSQCRREERGDDPGPAAEVARRTGILARTRVPPPERAFDRRAAVERLDAVREASRPVPRVGSAPPTPSSVDLDDDSCPSSSSKISTRASRGARVLRDVGERLGRDVVRGRLDRGREALLGRVDLDRERRAERRAPRARHRARGR